MVRIVQEKSKILREIAREVPFQEIRGRKIKDILRKMTEALDKRKEGVAIAAPQIGESLRIFIIDGNVWLHKEGAYKDGEKHFPQILPVVFINPVIKKISKKKQTVKEGCLSVEKTFGNLKRAEKITIEALDENGKKNVVGRSGFLSQIIQHEIDHLNGVLFIDEATGLEKISNV